MNKRVIVLANGTPPKKHLLQQFLQPDDVLVCADGGANAAAALSIVPQLILGDLDSVTEKTLNIFSKVPIKQIREQNSTDLEKALSYAVAHHFSEVLVFGATGGRADHEFGNFSALAKFSNSIDLAFIDQYGEYFALENETVIQLPIGTTVSLLPLALCDDVVTNGLRWNLNHESLGLGVRESTSNVVVADPVKIKFRSGRLLVFVAREMTNSKPLIRQSQNRK